MRIAIHATFPASRKEPLADMLARVRAAFVEAGLGEPELRFAMADSLLAGGVSSVERVLKRFPQVRPFAFEAPVFGGAAPVRHLGNGPGAPAAGEAIDFDAIAAIAAGVPRSFPFGSIAIHFTAPAFDAAGDASAGAFTPGVTVGDRWWVNGRNRSLSALTIVEVDAASKRLPDLPAPAAQVLAALGKARKTVQIPLPAAGPEGPGVRSPAGPPAGLAPQAAAAVRAVVEDYKSRFDEVLDRARLPHDLPDFQAAVAERSGLEPAGPLKPALVAAFGPMGYDCKGGRGTFTLRRRTSGGLTVEILLDVGTWSRLVMGLFSVRGLGFAARLPLPVSRTAGGGQYPIGDAARWGRIVENLAALAAELDRSFVPAVESASGPSPQWYRPES